MTDDGSHISSSSHDGLEILLANRQSVHPVDEQQLLSAARRILEDAEIPCVTMSVAVVDDRTIHELNLRYLDHSWPTDVLSFELERRDGYLEGEVVLSAETAASEAAHYGWTETEEQLLYLIHGMLHLVGYDDHTPASAAKMRAAENYYLHLFGVKRSDESHGPGDHGTPTLSNDS